jgi:hypothetical protein
MYLLSSIVGISMNLGGRPHKQFWRHCPFKLSHNNEKSHGEKVSETINIVLYVKINSNTSRKIKVLVHLFPSIFKLDYFLSLGVVL